MIVLVTGVSGAGKTTVGSLLATSLSWEFFDADDFHPPANIAKMARGEPLDDADRDGWLELLAGVIDRLLLEGRSAVLACSALRASYRARLRGSHRAEEVRTVYLRADPSVLRERLDARRGHFAKVDLLVSQLATLEEPQDALIVDANEAPATIAKQIRVALGLPA